MNSLIYFQEKNLRIAGSPDEPMFCGKDLCEMLGISSHKQALRSLPPDEKGGYTVDTPLGGPQEMVFVTEPGFYRLVFMSRKNEAEAIKSWVFKEVLPSIRKHGYYRAGREDIPPELKALPAGRRDFVILWLDICNEIAAAPRRMVKVNELAARFAGKRGFKQTNILRRFYAWGHSGGDWRVLDRYATLYKYVDQVPIRSDPPKLIIPS